MSFALENLKYLRNLRAWTQEEMANKLGMKRSNLAAVEEGRVKVSLDLAAVICRVFRLTMDDFYHTDLSDIQNRLRSNKKVGNLEKKEMYSVDDIRNAFNKVFPNWETGWHLLKTKL